MTFGEFPSLDSSRSRGSFELKWIADFRRAFETFDREFDRVDQRGDIDMLTWARRNAGDLLETLRGKPEHDMIQLALRNGHVSKIFEIAERVLR